MKRYLLLLILLFPSLVLANNSIQHSSGLSLSYPENWVVRKDQGVLSLQAPDARKGLVLLAEVPFKDKKPSLDEATKKAEELVQELVAEMFVLDQQPVEVHELKGQLVSGRGKLKSSGEEARWLALFVEHQGKIYCLRGVGLAEGWDWDRSMVCLVMNSLRAGL